MSFLVSGGEIQVLLVYMQAYSHEATICCMSINSCPRHLLKVQKHLRTLAYRGGGVGLFSRWAYFCETGVHYPAKMHTIVKQTCY